MKKILFALTFFIFATPVQAEIGESLTKARELMKVMGIEKTLTEHLSDADNIQRSGAFLISKIVAVNPDEESKVGDLLVDEARATLPEIVPSYVEYMAEVYAVYFSPAEIDQLIGFYKTEGMQEALQKTAESTDRVEFDSDQQAESNAFLQTPTGKKLQRKSPAIIKQINIYAADVVRKKQRDMIYASLREDLPKHGLKVPDPFAPDTFMDKTIHNNTVRANTLPSAMPPKPAPMSLPAQPPAAPQQSGPQPAITPAPVQPSPSPATNPQ